MYIKIKLTCKKHIKATKQQTLRDKNFENVYRDPRNAAMTHNLNVNKHF